MHLRARKPNGQLKLKLLHLLIERDGPFCHYCTKELSIDIITLDHKKPLGKGGTWHLDNLVISCRRCNLTKGILSYEEFKASAYAINAAYLQGIVDLEKLDCNCNNCVYMHRDLVKLRHFDALYDLLHGGHKQAWRIHYGRCTFFDKDVQFTPGQCQPFTQECFRHRKEYRLSFNGNKAYLHVINN